MMLANAPVNLQPRLCSRHTHPVCPVGGARPLCLDMAPIQPPNTAHGGKSGASQVDRYPDPLTLRLLLVTEIDSKTGVRNVLKF
jgi:hypothetical protein